VLKRIAAVRGGRTGIALALAVLLAAGSVAVPGTGHALDAVAALEFTPDAATPSVLATPLWTGDAPRTEVAAGAARTAMNIIGREQRHGVLRGVLGAQAPRVVRLGTLQDHGSTIGVTALLALPVARLDVRATVPGTPPVRFVSPILRDVLVDVDLRHDAIVAVQPGPGSPTSVWSAPPSISSPQATVARTAPAFARLSPNGPAFATYDGAQGVGRVARDWPVSLIFTGHATVGKVKRALRSAGFTHVGEQRRLGYRTAGGAVRFDGDRGVKTACDPNGTDVHLRLYAPPKADHFTDPRFGNVVIATAHLDRGESCTTPPRLFGFSEEAERRVADLAAGRLGWHVQRDAVPLGNAEPYRRDIAAPDHVWWSNGRATIIQVP
jgi:hypothetical protein